MSTQIAAVILNLLVVLLPYIGITVDSQQLETTIQTTVAVITGIWIWLQNRKLHEAIELGKSEATTLGMKA